MPARAPVCGVAGAESLSPELPHEAEMRATAVSAHAERRTDDNFIGSPVCSL